ncbi:MAG: hypothetical protein OZ921_06985 [Sorangiineae bacterium]|nr:hypothetical protein [Sorangiineae bacterium]
MVGTNDGTIDDRPRRPRRTSLPAAVLPDANRIERVWQDPHANVTRKHRRKTMNHLLANARDYLTAHVWRRVTGAAPLCKAA